MATPLKKISDTAASLAPPQAFVPFAELEKVCSIVREFAAWEPNWDGYGAVLPAQADINNAIDFIRQIPFAVETPKAMIGGDGDVGFKWRKGNTYVEVGFTEGDISFFICPGADDERVYGDEKYKGQIPDSLLQGIARTMKIGV